MNKLGSARCRLATAGIAIRLGFLYAVLLFAALPLAPVSFGQVEQAKLKARKYLEQNTLQKDDWAIFILDTLNRVYDYKFDIALAKKNLFRQPRAMRVWLRYFDDGYRMPELEVRSQKIWPGLVASALHCDIYPLPWNFLPRLREVSMVKRYGVTQSLLLIKLVQWRGCTFDSAAFERQIEMFAREIPSVLQQTAVGEDLWIECILLLYLTDHRDWVTDDLLQLLAASQAKDGSWNSNSHSTAKAVWVFLEAAKKNTRSSDIGILLRRRRS